MQQVVGAALRGYVATIAASKGIQGPIKIMLNGYGAFGSVVDNPTAQFVSNSTNLDCAMRLASGTSMSERVLDRTISAGTTYRYLIANPTTGGPREVWLHATAFSVDDSAIDGRPGSVQDLMAQFQPHAMLSLGYHGMAACYMAEHYASSGELSASASGFKRSIGAPA